MQVCKLMILHFSKCKLHPLLILIISAINWECIFDGYVQSIWNVIVYLWIDGGQFKTEFEDYTFYECLVHIIFFCLFNIFYCKIYWNSVDIWKTETLCDCGKFNWGFSASFIKNL